MCECNFNVGPNAPIVENELGGKQSKPVGAFHLIDPVFMYGLFSDYWELAVPVLDYINGDIDKDDMAARLIWDKENKQKRDILLMIARTMEYGIGRYKLNNWRLIPEEDHLNHALTHLFMAEIGNTDDDHIAHFYTRIMMSYATKPSKEFERGYKALPLCED